MNVLIKGFNLRWQLNIDIVCLMTNYFIRTKRKAINKSNFIVRSKDN